MLTDCTIQLYLVTQWGYATLKKGNWCVYVRC